MIELELMEVDKEAREMRSFVLNTFVWNSLALSLERSITVLSHIKEDH